MSSIVEVWAVRKCMYVDKYIILFAGLPDGWFQNQNPHLGKFWSALHWKMFIYFMATWNILQTLVMFYDHWVHFGNLKFWNHVPKKNLSTLLFWTGVQMQSTKCVLCSRRFWTPEKDVTPDVTRDVTVVTWSTPTLTGRSFSSACCRDVLITFKKSVWVYCYQSLHLQFLQFRVILLSFLIIFTLYIVTFWKNTSYYFILFSIYFIRWRSSRQTVF
jgi:hypothetical protein